MADYAEKTDPVTFRVEDEYHSGAEQLHDSDEYQVQYIFITNGFE